MMEWIRQTSSHPRARTTGAVYLLYFLTAILAQTLVGRKLVAYGNATNLIATGCYVVLTLLLYLLFKPVNRTLSDWGTLQFGGMRRNDPCTFSSHFITHQPAIVLWTYCMLIGYLIFKSTFLPRVLGVLMALAGLGWLAYLPLIVVRHLSIYIEILGIFSEAALYGSSCWVRMFRNGMNRLRQRERP